MIKNVGIIVGLALCFFSTASGAGKSKSHLPVSFEFEHVSCRGEENEIRLVVTKVRESVGLIVADLYLNDADGFLKGSERALQVSFAARSPATNFCITAPTPGMFAISIYHDENANKSFDKGAFGLPAEPYGVSQNPKFKMRAPRIDEAIFEVATEGANMEIRLKN